MQSPTRWLQSLDSWVITKLIDIQGIEVVSKINFTRSLIYKIKWLPPTLCQILKSQTVVNLNFSLLQNKFSKKVREFYQSGVSKTMIQFYGNSKIFWHGRYLTTCCLQRQGNHRVSSNESKRSWAMCVLMWIILIFSNTTSSHKELKNRRSHS